MMTSTANDAQRRAIELPFGGCVVITGAAGTGKSTTLNMRLDRLRREEPHAAVLSLQHPSELAQTAFELLAHHGTMLTPIDDVEAELLFASSAQPLFALEWDVFEAELDPEVPALRSPERFLEAAFRLFRKLRDAAIGPSEFLTRALSGATAFYAKPPNFAHPDLLYATKDAYRDSLDVTPEELQRQYRREVDLAKILARLYEEYVNRLGERAVATPSDAIVLCLERLRLLPAGEPTTHTRYAFVDDAQEITTAQFSLLQTLFGESLAGVTFAGDPACATSTFRGARPDQITRAGERIELCEQYRSPLGIELAVRQLCSDLRRPEAVDVPPAVRLYRGRSQVEEARFIATDVEDRLAAGVPPREIALLFRSVSDVHVYEAALLDRDIPVSVGGNVNIFAHRHALDALALLWNVWDPFRHDYLLRTLSNPGLALADGTLARLCSEPPDAQRPLFVLDEEAAPTMRSGRWDPKRDLRLGWNVIRGDQDNALGPVARERIERFRRLREGWVAALYAQPLDAFIHKVWSEGLTRAGKAGSARALAQEHVLQRLRSRLLAYRAHNPHASFGDLLVYAQHRASSELESCEDALDERFVRILSIDAARGSSFRHVIVADARAGSFPRWYVPDAFLFSPALGMIPKENVGAAHAARTAKFSYYLYRSKARENYNAEERRAFVYALRRASESVLVTASERSTRGITAPEFLEELRAARLPGTVSEDAPGRS